MLQWSDVLKDKSLQNLPYKIELDARGRIVMTPASNRHARYQSEIATRLTRLLPNGKVFTEGSIATIDGVKVADVAWASKLFRLPIVVLKWMKRLPCISPKARVRFGFAMNKATSLSQIMRAN